MYVLRPGAISSPRNLDEMLRCRHELERQAVLDERERRERDGIPLSEDAPWHERAGDALAALNDATAAQDLAAARAALLPLRAALAEPLPVPDEYAPDPEAASLWVRFRSLSHQEHVDLARAIAEEGEASGYLAPSTLDRVRDYVAAAVDSIEGFEDEEGPFALESEGGRLSDESLDVLRASGRLSAVFVAARDFQGLGGAEKKAFGRPRPTTSSTSASAGAAHNGDETQTDATALPLILTGETQSTRTTPVLAGTSSITHGLSTPIKSTSPPTAESSASTG